MKSKQPDALKQARNVRGLSSAPSATDPTFPAWCKAVTLTAAIAAGCTGAQLRPEPFECSPGALEAMEKELGWRIPERFALKLDDRGSTYSHFYRPGPVVGVVTDIVDNDPNQMRKAPPGTRFFGKVYVVPGKTGYRRLGEIIAVYDRVKLPNREEVPVCFVVGGGDAVAAPIEEFKGDTAKSFSVAEGFAVESWR